MHASLVLMCSVLCLFVFIAYILVDGCSCLWRCTACLQCCVSPHTVCVHPVITVPAAVFLCVCACLCTAGFVPSTERRDGEDRHHLHQRERQQDQRPGVCMCVCMCDKPNMLCKPVCLHSFTPLCTNVLFCLSGAAVNWHWAFVHQHQPWGLHWVC